MLSFSFSQFLKENHNDNIKNVRIQLRSKKSQEELIQQNFLELLLDLITLNLLYTLAAISTESLTTASNANVKHTTKIFTFLFSMEVCFSRTFSTSYLKFHITQYIRNSQEFSQSFFLCTKRKS